MRGPCGTGSHATRSRDPPLRSLFLVGPTETESGTARAGLAVTRRPLMNQRHRSYPRVTFRDRIAIPIARADRRWLSGLATTLLLIVGCGGSVPTTTAPSVATGSSDVAEATLRGDVAQGGAGGDEGGSTGDFPGDT